MENYRNSKTITGLRAGKAGREVIYSDLIPSSNNYYDLGSTVANWQDVYGERGNFNESVGTDLITANTIQTSSLSVTNNLSMLASVATIFTLNATNASIANSITTKDLSVTGTITLASQPEFDGFVASGGVILKDGLLIRGGTTSREGLICYDGLDCNKSLQCNGYFVTNGQAHMLGETYINTPIYKSPPNETYIKQLLIQNGDKCITGPYITDTGYLRFYYIHNNLYYYSELDSVQF